MTITLLSACGASLSPQAIEDKYTNAHSQFIHIDQHRVHYRDEGEGETIVLLHGTASSLHTWDKWTEHLRKNHRVIRLDLPGSGLTGGTQMNRYEVADDTHFLARFLQALDITHAHFVGSSLGGRIAWQYALTHPEQVHTLTLINALGYEQESWPPAIQLGQWPVFDTLMEYVSPRFMYTLGMHDIYANTELITQDLVDRYYELSRYTGNLAAFTRRVKARLDQDATQIKGIRQPTLILWGQEDKYFPVENAYRFQQDIPRATIKTYASVGHLPMEELPKRSAQDFMRFVVAHTNKD